MNTHRDRDHEVSEAWKALEDEAMEMKARRLSTITAGEEGEEPIRTWELYGVHVRELPEREIDAPLDLSRISIGGIPGGMAYLVFRGPLREVKDVLRRALNALRDVP